MATARDYEFIAKAIYTAYSEVTDDKAKSVITHTTVYIADALAKDNPRFDRVRFYVAAGVPQRSFAYRKAVRTALAEAKG